MYNRNLQSTLNAMKSLSVNGELLASYEEISKKAALPRRTVARAIKELTHKGVIKKIHAKGRGITNIYYIGETP